MLRVIFCIVFVLSSGGLPLQSQEQERRVVTLRFGFAADGPLRTFSPVPEGAEVTFSSRIEGEGTFRSFRFIPIIGKDSEVVVTIFDSEGTLMGEVTLPQNDECEVIETDTSPPLWIGVVTDECEVIETRDFRFEVERD